MKCFQCKTEIHNEFQMIHLGDGDFVCNETCKIKFEQKRNEFFDNIHDDVWYDNYLKTIKN